MRTLIPVLLLSLLISGCATSKVKSAGQKIERVKEIQRVSYDQSYLYIQFSAIDRTRKTEGVFERWARMPLNRLWVNAERTARLTNLSYEPEIITYQGVEYSIIKYHLNDEISESPEYGWEIITDESTIGELTESVAIAKERNSEINPENPVFGEVDSDLFLFTYPDKDPQLVLVNRKEKKALVVWRFAKPSGYEFTPEKYRSIKAVATPLATTVDVVTLPVLIPVILTADPSGK
ncbi:hypothetical protein [Coraliomargarita akajimensis]|uniref:Lipoprotein n=1 Tax=Coraliomargarita akajimensis (strain DSM 45221 / IAM 15411 / JCM 23193 / KCTC 12865 / 04OKA010-24) TaxID=583355 RepID=D5EMC1_CORAD|nr:hypothetical protein [Coraliomargarita akajimensis]ADE53327.1 hypothetical protein Caka_0301 [Coraliomargarita akajimensis DSM 45221]